MTLIEATILGVVQGLTEFLPISSSGHLVLAQHVLGLGGSQNLQFDILLHVATLFAVVWSLREDVLKLVRGLFVGGAERRVCCLLVAAMVPTTVVAFAGRDYVAAAFDRPEAVAVALVVTGVILFAASRLRWSTRSLYDLRVREALVIGLAQGLAVVPGISRSGATIGAGVGMGVRAEDAARFSFLLSILAITGAMAVGLTEPGAMEGVRLPSVAAGMAAAWVAGVLSIRWLLRIARRGRFDGFAYYCWALGGIALVATVVRHLSAA